MKKCICMCWTLMLLVSLMVIPAAAEEAIVNRYCSHCLNWVDWTPWDGDDAALTSIPTGHYYLSETINCTKTKKSMGIVCIDLNGHSMNFTGRALLASRAQMTDPGPNDRPVFNIFDSVGGGRIVSTGGTNNPGGGAVGVTNGGQVNLYSGTLKFISTDGGATTCGGVVCLYTKNVFNPEFNMYGGCLDASECVLSGDEKNLISACDDGCGGTLAVAKGGVANLMGGVLISGKTNPEEGRGDCVYLHSADSQVNIGGDVKIPDIYMNVPSASNFRITDAFTGSVQLTFAPTITLEEAVDVGDLVLNGSISGGTLSCSAEGFFVDVLDKNLVLSYANPNAEATITDGNTPINYDTWEEAFQAADGRLVRLNKPISDDINLQQDLYLDLNGCDITGKVTAAEGATLYCMDSETDDFTIKDGKFGKLTDVFGNVVGMPLEASVAEDAYILIEKDGAKSFHRIGLQLTAMTLRPESAGVYYKSIFGGDEMVETLVDSFGVAMSVMETPTTVNLDTSCKYSVFTNFVSGENNTETTSTLLKGVLKTSNHAFINSRNAQTSVHGRAYMKLKDGTYLFGQSASRSFREQIERVNAVFSTLSHHQKESVYELYKTYQDEMKYWDIANIIALKDPSKDNVLKILNISNSHGQDAIWQLPSVLRAEQPDQEILIVSMYQGYALTEHIEAAKTNAAVYHYNVNTGEGWTTITKEKTIKDGLREENWDYVMFNESSRHLGLESKMSQGMVDWFHNYLLSNLDYQPKMLYNMTWASPTDNNFYTDTSRQRAPDSFRNTYSNHYGFSHVNHYNKLVELTKKYLVGHEGFHKIMYNATPVQYAGEVLGVPQYDPNQVYDLYRDYTHLSDFARLIVAYNMYCQLFDVEELEDINIEVIRWQDRATWNNRHQKLGDLLMTEQHKSILIKSVNHTLKYPLSITAE